MCCRYVSVGASGSGGGAGALEALGAGGAFGAALAEADPVGRAGAVGFFPCALAARGAAPIVSERTKTTARRISDPWGTLGDPKSTLSLF